MSRFPSRFIWFLATCLLAVGPATGVIAAESNRFGVADFPETNPLTPNPNRPAAVAAPQAEVPPPQISPAPSVTETKPAKTGVISGIIPAIRRMFTFKRSSSPAVETPPVVQSPPPVVAAKSSVSPAQANVKVAPTSTVGSAPASAVTVNAAPAPAPAPALAAPPPVKAVAEMPPVESVAPAVTSSRFNWLKRNREPTASVPALVAGALPTLRSEARRTRAPNLSRQTRLDMDQRIERLGPELEPVSGSDVISGASVASAPVVAGVEETVLTLEAAAVVQAKAAAAGGGAGVMSGKITRRSDEIKLIPNDAKQRERFREVSVFFDPPPPKSSKPTETPTSSATYETK